VDEGRRKNAFGLEFLDEVEREVKRVAGLSEEFLWRRERRWGCLRAIEGDDSGDDGGRGRRERCSEGAG